MDNLCPACGSVNIVKSGKHYSKKGPAQRYRCKICGVSWSSGGYFKYKFPVHIINEAINYYRFGLSLEKVMEKIKETFGYDLTRTTVLNWIRKAGVTPRPQRHSKARKTQKNREIIRIFTSTTIFYSSSLIPMKIILFEEEDENLVKQSS